MSGEIRIKTKNLLILVLLVLGLVWLLSTRNVCKNLQVEVRDALDENLDLPRIYAITPTYTRPVQKAELTRLSQAILLVPNIFWVIVEDADENTDLVRNLLKRAGLEKRSVLLKAKTPPDFKLKGKDPNWLKPRGVEQRNVALSWIRAYLSSQVTPRPGIIFFMDDDNTYSVELFREMAQIERGRVGVWPVGLVGGLMVERPLLDENNVVIGFNAAWRPERQFCIDMAGSPIHGFAISADLLLQHPEAKFSYEVQRGYQETEILRQVTTVAELQPMANNCREVLVWHTRTEKPKLSAEEALIKANKPPTDEGMEV